MAEISVLPNWKKGASAYERLEELALHARQFPEKYERFAIVYQEQKPDGNWVMGTVTFMKGGEGLTFLEKLGMFTAAIQKAWQDSLA